MTVAASATGPDDVTWEVSWDPRTGTPVGETPATSAVQVEVTLAAASADAQLVATAPPARRAEWLRAVATAIEQPGVASELVSIADRETALGLPRLQYELGRAAAQLRFYADVAEEGSYLRATIDGITASSPSLARIHVPLGPVAVFGASNFPFGFGVLGNDTASALASGCPVVAKAHPAHPALSARLGELATAALVAAGAPSGTFGLVAGFAAGTTLVTSRHTAAVAFTGSQRGGLALWRLANEREVVIPVFAEMGTVNPVVVTRAGAERLDAVAAGAVASFTLGAGQFCTKPGLLLVPSGFQAADRVGAALVAAAPSAWELTREIAAAATTGVTELTAAGATVAADVPAPRAGWGTSPAVLQAPIAALTRGSRLLEECFGPVLVVAEYADDDELDRALGELQGALVASIMTSGPDDPETPALLTRLAGLAGRVAVDDWPTGVAWTWAQQHGGPWPGDLGTRLDLGRGRSTRPLHAARRIPERARPCPSARAAGRQPVAAAAPRRRADPAGAGC